MKKNPTSTGTEAKHCVSGTVRDQFQKPLAGVTVAAFDKDIRSEQELGRDKTDKAGRYEIKYSRARFAATDLRLADLFVRLYDAKGNPFFESPVTFNAPESFVIDINLSSIPYQGISEFEQTEAAVLSFTGKIPLSDLTETDKIKDISFLASKTNLSVEKIADLAMAFRFGRLAKIHPAVFYGLIRENISSNSTGNALNQLGSSNFESGLTYTHDLLMRQHIDVLMNAVQKAITDNVVPFVLTKDIEQIKSSLLKATRLYVRKHPVAASPSVLLQNLQVSGLSAPDAKEFTTSLSTRIDGFDAFVNNPGAAGLPQAGNEQQNVIAQLHQLTGHHTQLVQHLQHRGKIQTTEDLKKLAGHDAEDWQQILNDINDGVAPQRELAAKSQNSSDHARRLEANFARKFPTASYAQKLQKDPSVAMDQHHAIASYLNNHPAFDLLNTRIHQFINANPDPDIIDNKEAFTKQLKKVQRVFKLAANYKSTQTLLASGMNSAAQIHRLGRDNFVRKFAAQLGQKAARDIFQKATQAHAQSVTLAANLKSLSDASPMQVFPDFTAMLAPLAAEIPDLNSLFGDGDYCECNDCNSVYGAAAYLTDILHYLDKRIPDIGSPSVKSRILLRRPDIGDIDLNCDNTNTEIPYIDIACELLEDYIMPPLISLTIASLTTGLIDASTLSLIQTQFALSGFSNISNLLTDRAVISESFTNTRYIGSVMISETHWIIRDSLVVMKATQTITGLTIQLLHQTLLGSDDVSANPEYLNLPVYQDDAAHGIKGVLNNAQRPFTLPFDLFETEALLYLQKLGINKYDLIDIFNPEHDSSGPPNNSLLNVAYAYLSVNQAEQLLIFSADPANQVNYWGLLSAGPGVAVNDFENATGLRYADIINLLACTFINPTGSIVIQHADLSCNTQTQSIINLTSDSFDRLHRFIRLWRKTGLPMNELDAIIAAPAIGNGSIDPACALELYHFLERQKAWNLGSFELLAFYQLIDISRPDNLYNQLFQNRSVTNPVNPDFSISNVTAGSTVITAIHQSVISAATGISGDDLVNLLLPKTDGKLSLSNLSFFYRSYLLSEALSISIEDELDLLDIINLDPFTDPLGTASFCDQFSNLATSGFSAADLNYVLRHQDDAGQDYIPTDNVISAALSGLQGLLLQVQAATNAAPDPQGALLSKWLNDPVLNWDSSLITTLFSILSIADDDEYVQKITISSDFLLNLRVSYNASRLSANLGSLPGFNAADQAVYDGFATQLSFDPVNRLLVWKGYMSPADQITLSGLTSATAAFNTAVGLLFSQAQLTDNSASNILFHSAADLTTLQGIAFVNISDRFSYFLQIISPVYQHIKQENTIAGQISSWFSADKNLTAQLLVSIPAIFALYTDPGFINKLFDLTTANYPAQFNQYLQLQKISFLAKKLKLSAADMEWQIPNAPMIGSLDLLSLPLTPITGPINSFANFVTLIDILKFEQFHPLVILDPATVPVTSISVYDILTDGINGSPVAAIINDLVTLTGWDIDDLTKLTESPNYLNLTQAPPSLPQLYDFSRASVLLRLHECFTILALLECHADDAMAWSANTVGYSDAVKLVQTLKTNYSDDDWLAVTQPLQDVLRERKRDALIAYLLANPGTQSWKTDTDLYSYFLLDVEMCACQSTSRIVQAANSVQLFVQRCFLALEPGIVVNTTTDSDWDQWQWMKFYRLWQANYEVFLFPENYIEPELLPVKSTFFTDLENTLLQNDVTKENVEDAFMAYLESLDGVARLEVKGMWNDDSSNTLYVVARTYGGDPKIYYFRQWEGDSGTWTPWVKVDVDISSEQIIPVVYNNRFYIFWGVISEQSYTPTSANIPDTTQKTTDIQQPYKYWKIQLAYSEYKNKKWTPKKVSNNDPTGIITADQTNGDPGYTPLFPDPAAFLFTAVDLPQIDLATLEAQYKSGNYKDLTFIQFLLQNVQTSLSQNGDLIINCYYCNPDENTNQPFGFSYLGGFDLDPCRGYPVVVRDHLYVKPWFFDHTGLTNMLDTEHGDQLSISSQPILQVTPSIFRTVLPFQMGFLDRFVKILLELAQSNTAHYGAISEQRITVSLGTFMSYFYQDYNRTYYVRPEITDNGNFEFLYSDLENYFLALLDQNATELQQILSTIPQNDSFSVKQRFLNFYHPLVCYFMRTLFTKGIEVLMSRATQLTGDIAYDPNPDKFSFRNTYSPASIVYSGQNAPVTYPNALPVPLTDNNPGYPREDVDFNPASGYALYNWELFFHAPLMIAERLDQNQQFEDAETWYRYIFNPSDTSAYASPDKYWNTKPFFINVNDRYNQQNIANILLNVNAGAQDLVNDVSMWRNNPFQPHYIASYRTIAYQKTTVMKYLDHLIAWADNLFTQDTMESVNEATQLYLLASQILGPKPQIIPPADELPVESFYQLEPKLDSLSNAVVDIENLLPLQTVQNYNGITPQPSFPSLQTLYFCLPANDQLLCYWDTIAQRLYNIRHCLNIDGVYSPLALFAPPINPMLLVRATAEGLDIGSILNDLNSPLPYYRFVVMLPKATELIDEVKSLGASLLSALEKYDAETMALLRSNNEINLLKAIMNVKTNQVKEAQANFDGANKQKEMITIRQTYYKGLINAGYNAGEIASLALSGMAIGVEIAATIVETLAGVAHLIPGIEAGAAGFGGSPTLTVKFGGQEVGSSVEAAGRALRGTAGVLQAGASIASTVAGFTRRADEWQFQLDLANKELEQIDKQILAAKIRLDIANTEVTNQQLQITNNQSEDDLLHSKFTNQDLYSWMITQISTVYFQGYHLAYAAAKKAEKCFRYELGLDDSSYINFGYWNSLKKGLLAGEQLKYDLKNMELAYYEQNQRQFELTKHISLAQLDPSALLKLKTNKDCWLNLPEELFDLDYPGHYFRRIKSVSITIPCVAGPYTTISCSLTLNKNSMRISADAAGAYPRKMVSGIPGDDLRFRDTVTTVQSIATSGGQNDSGLFELNFRDDRYLPFEGTGAISLWRIQLPAAMPGFDYDTITDVIIHLNYTAKDGGDSLSQAAAANVSTAINTMLVSQKDKGLMRIFSVRHEFPTAWYQFLHPINPTDQQVLTLPVTTDRFPFFAQFANVKVLSIELVADTANAVNNIELDIAASVTGVLNLTGDNIYGSLMHGTISSVNKTVSVTNSPWTVKYPQAGSLPNNLPLTESTINDLYLLVHYQLT